VGFELVEPHFYVFESGLLAEIEDEQCSDGSFIVCAGDGFEGLLSCSVPDL
jgi:hypothetical protein